MHYLVHGRVHYRAHRLGFCTETGCVHYRTHKLDFCTEGKWHRTGTHKLGFYTRKGERSEDVPDTGRLCKMNAVLAAACYTKPAFARAARPARRMSYGVVWYT